MKYFSLLMLLLLIACNSDDPSSPIIELTTSDFAVSVEENPELNGELGTIESSINDESVSFNIDEISVGNAILIDQNTGVVKVADPSLFDFEAREQITGIISVSNGETTVYSNLTINIIDVFDENILRLSKILDSNGSNPSFGSLFCDQGIAIGYNENDSFKHIFTTHTELGWSISLQGDGTKITKYNFNVGDDGSYNDLYQLTYNVGGQISSFVNIEKWNGEIFSSIDYEVTYNGNTIEVKNLETNGSRFIILNSIGFVESLIAGNNRLDYQYDVNGNLISKTYQDGNTVTYTYDNKRNPFRDIAYLNWNEVQNIRFALNFNSNGSLWSNTRNHGIWKSKNNIIAIDVSNCNSNLCPYFSLTYELEYNSDGYPIKGTFEGLSTPLEYIYE